MSAIVTAAALVAGLTASPASAAPPDRDGLRQAMADLLDVGAAGVQVRVHDEQGDWAGSAGVRKLSGGEVSPEGHYRAGSITKMFVSTVALQLVDEGRFALDDPIDEYLPEYGIDPRITVRMLLQHTSGLFNYTGQLNPDGTFEPGIPLIGKEYLDNRFRTYRPEELIAVSLAKPANFEPGTSWQYSNTNYIIIGQLIERLTGTSYVFQVRQRILRPLGLRDTTFPGTRPGIPGPHAHGYAYYVEDDEFRVADVSHGDMSFVWAAGEVVSTTRDLDRFVTALLGGDLLPPDLLAEMRDVLPLGADAGYGLGLLALDFGSECGGVFEGHDGAVPGYFSYLLSTGDGDRRLELSVTLGTVEDPTDPEVSRRFFAAVNTLLVTAACGTPDNGKVNVVASDRGLLNGLA